MSAQQTDPVLPRFYLQHTLPDGTARYAYHADLIEQSGRDRWGSTKPGSGWTWGAVARDGSDEIPCGIEWSGDWLIADQRIDTLTRRKPGPRIRAGWAKRETADYGGPAPGDPVKLHAAAPEQPEQAWIDHYAEHDAQHACWKCRQFVAHYEPAWQQGPEVVEHQDLSGVELLPGGMPPRIDVEQWRHRPTGSQSGGPFSGNRVQPADPQWTVDDPSALVVFGQGAAHLLPGRLSGFRSAVAAVLSNHPRVGKFYDWHGPRSATGRHGFEVTVRVPWETRRTRTEHVKPTPRSRKTVPVQRDVWAIEQSVQIEVPDAIAAPNLAAAIAAWDDEVERTVARFFPYGDVAACDHCQGRGYVARPTGPGGA